MNELVPLNNSSSAKMKELTNWDKPGGKLGIVIAGLLGAAALIGLYKILPFLINLATSVLTLALLCLAIAALLWLITNKDFRRMWSIGYFMLMRKLTGIFIEIDPIAIVQRRVAMLKKKMENIQQLLGKLNGTIKESERKLKERTNEFETEVQKVKVYNEQGKSASMEAQVSNRQVVRLQELINTYKENLTQSNKWYEILTKLYQMAQLTVNDTESEVEIRTEQFEQIKKQHSTFKSIMSVFKGDPDEVALFNNAMDYMAKDISDKLGEMEFIINSADGLMDKYEMGKILSSKQADEIISRYDQYGIDGVFTNFGEAKVLLPNNNKELDIQDAQVISETS
ncbi:MAG: gp58-like family protein, partial [Candidatus Azobacteroides sp.]|nr:gp58-like family protein [Candidatus Azobacteroides sp.]